MEPAERNLVFVDLSDFPLITEDGREDPRLQFIENKAAHTLGNMWSTMKNKKLTDSAIRKYCNRDVEYLMKLAIKKQAIENRDEPEQRLWIESIKNEMTNAKNDFVMLTLPGWKMEDVEHLFSPYAERIIARIPLEGPTLPEHKLDIAVRWTIDYAKSVVLSNIDIGRNFQHTDVVEIAERPRWRADTPYSKVYAIGDFGAEDDNYRKQFFHQLKKGQAPKEDVINVITFEQVVEQRQKSAKTKKGEDKSFIKSSYVTTLGSVAGDCSLPLLDCVICKNRTNYIRPDTLTPCCEACFEALRGK